MRYRELAKRLRRLGCEIERQGGEVIQFGVIPLQVSGALLPIGAVKIFHPAQYAAYCGS